MSTGVNMNEMIVLQSSNKVKECDIFELFTVGIDKNIQLACKLVKGYYFHFFK